MLHGAKEDFSLAEIIAESGGGIVIAFVAVISGFAERSEMKELFFLCVGCAVAAPVISFLIRLVFITGMSLE